MSAQPVGRLEVHLEMNEAHVWMMMNFEPGPGVEMSAWLSVESYPTWAAAMEVVEDKVKALPGVDLVLDDRT